jgi:hypothetical protein
MNAHETPMLGSFKLRVLQRVLQLNHNIVIAMSFNHLTVRETQDDPLSSPELSLSI